MAMTVTLYLEIARRRIEHAQMQPPLDGLL